MPLSASPIWAFLGFYFTHDPCVWTPGILTIKPPIENFWTLSGDSVPISTPFETQAQLFTGTLPSLSRYSVKVDKKLSQNSRVVSSIGAHDTSEPTVIFLIDDQCAYG